MLDMIVYPNRFAAVIGSLMMGRPDLAFWNIIYSMSDFYYKKLGWGIFNIMFTHIVMLIMVYSLLILLFESTDVFKNIGKTMKFLIYFVTFMIVLTITLLLPSI